MIRALKRDLIMSGRQDSNLRPPAPKAGAITGLRYAPILFLRSANIKVIVKQKIISTNDCLFSAFY